MAKVSLIIPTFNRPHLLPRCVDSARKAGSSVEIIVVDDASYDETASVCQMLRDIKYVRLDSNKGVAGARNEGLRASTSEYVGFLDDDDLRLPNSIDAQVKMLDAHPDAGMVYGRALYGDEQCQPNGRSYPDECPEGDVFWRLMEWNFVPCLTVIFRRACLERVGLLDESAAGVDDWDLWVRISELYPVLATKQEVAIWRQPTPASNQFSFRAERMHRGSHRLHRDKWLQLARSREAPEEQRNQASRAFADRATQQMISEASSRFRAGRALDSIRLALEIARLYPRAAVRHALRASIGSSEASDS
jgi:glycosyltransferase involved in cell wall biosynthesis